MRKPKKAYAVSAGSYSDYRIAAIFDTRERAGAYLRQLGFVSEMRTPYRQAWTEQEPDYEVWVSHLGEPEPNNPERWNAWCKWNLSLPEALRSEEPFIEEFDYHDGDVLPLNDANVR